MRPLSALNARRARDVTGLFEFQRRYPELLGIRGLEGDPVHTIELALRIPTAVDAEFPRRRRPACRVQIHLPNRYPFEPAQVSVVDPVFNPNVFPSGTVCLGGYHQATRPLSDVVLQTMRIIALDPEVINCVSPANGEAAVWYKRQRKGGLFPTVSLRDFEVRASGGVVFREAGVST